MSVRKPLLNGVRLLRSAKRSSVNKTASSQQKLHKLLAQVYDRFQKMEDPKTNAICKRNFVFHMTDWTPDLTKLAELYNHPGKFNKKSAGDVVAGFLLHVIPHLRAAGRLMLDYIPEDFFKEIDYKD